MRYGPAIGWAAAWCAYCAVGMVCPRLVPWLERRFLF